MVDYQRVFQDFCKEIIQGNNDTRNQRWQSISQELQHDAINIKMNILNTKGCICAALKDADVDILKTLDDLENSFYCLSQYALNLCRQPHNPEYGFLKTYTGYYSGNISSVMNGSDTHILELMGYKVRPDCENSDEYILEPPIRHIEELTFELFLSQPYYRRMKQLCEDAINNKFDRKVIVRMLGHDLADVIAFGVRTVCEQIQSEDSGRSSSLVHEPIKHSEHTLPNASSAYSTYHSKLVGDVDAVDDEDLYSCGPQDSGLFGFQEKPTSKFQEIPGNVSAAVVYDDAAFDNIKLKEMPRTIATTALGFQQVVKPPYPREAVTMKNSESESNVFPSHNTHEQGMFTRTRNTNSQMRARSAANLSHRSNSLTGNESRTTLPFQNQYESLFPSFNQDVQLQNEEWKREDERIMSEGSLRNQEGHIAGTYNHNYIIGRTETDDTIKQKNDRVSSVDSPSAWNKTDAYTTGEDPPKSPYNRRGNTTFYTGVENNDYVEMSPIGKDDLSGEYKKVEPVTQQMSRGNERSRKSKEKSDPSNEPAGTPRDSHSESKRRLPGLYSDNMPP